MEDKDIIEAARKRLSQAADADEKNRERARDDLKALRGDHWPEDIRAQREAEGRPCLTVNKLPQFVRQVTGDIRQTNPSIDIRPADGSATPEIADLYEGMIRQIQYASDASSVYEGAAESAAQCGMGYFRVRTDYEHEASFNQEILIERIHNPFSVYFDPDAKAATREDAQWVLITEHLTGEQFKAQHPEARSVDVETDTYDHPEYWRDGESIVVAEYFWIEWRDARLVMLESGHAVVDPKGPVRSVMERKTRVPQVRWAKISGAEVLEGPQDFPSRYIPVIAVMGEELHLGDEIYRSSVIRHAIDPQRMYNYWVSADTELVALQPKAPWLVTAAQVSGYEEMWGSANTENRPYLVYNPDPKAAPPQRQQPPVSSPAMIQKIAMASDDMKATTGIYDASLGQRSNEQSGVAIRQRQAEADVSTSVYSDNMGKAIAHCGRVLVDMIPRVYDTSRMVMIVGKDGADALAAINQPVMAADGIAVQNNVAMGKYSVRVSVGPSYTTRRQEAAESMMEFIRVFPQAATATGDLIAENMDWPGADQFAARLKKMMPPGLADPDDKDPQAAQQQAVQQQQAAQMQQAAQQVAMRKDQAEAAEAEANAAQAQAQAQKAMIELHIKQFELQMLPAKMNAAAMAARAPIGAEPGRPPL